MVARLREHGAVLLGKTTTPEFGWKGVTDSPLTGITRNPWNPKMTPGGSSGGGAAAVAAGMGPLTVGTDGGGSIRIPCGFTGLFGLKPSFGRVPAWPLSPIGTVAHVGPMTRTVADAALMMNVLSLPDARDWHALPHDARDYRIGLDDGVKGLRIAYSADLGYAKVDPEIAAIVKKAVKTFAGPRRPRRSAGSRLRELRAAVRGALVSGRRLRRAQHAPAQARADRPGPARDRAHGREGHAPRSTSTRSRSAARSGVLMNRFHETYDLLVTPTLPLAAFEAGKEVANLLKEKRWTDWSPFSYPVQPHAAARGDAFPAA